MESNERNPVSQVTFVTLTPAQRVSRDRNVDAWTRTLIQQARDSSDPETQANAQLLLRNRGIRW